MQELWFLRSASRLRLIDIYIKFREDSLNGFQVIERTQVWQTDRQMSRGKTVCLPTLKRGDIIITLNMFLFFVFLKFKAKKGNNKK